MRRQGQRERKRKPFYTIQTSSCKCLCQVFANDDRGLIIQWVFSPTFISRTADAEHLVGIRALVAPPSKLAITPRPIGAHAWAAVVPRSKNSITIVTSETPVDEEQVEWVLYFSEKGFLMKNKKTGCSGVALHSNCKHVNMSQCWGQVVNRSSCKQIKW